MNRSDYILGNRIKIPRPAPERGTLWRRISPGRLDGIVPAEYTLVRGVYDGQVDLNYLLRMETPDGREQFVKIRVDNSWTKNISLEKFNDIFYFHSYRPELMGQG